MGTFIEIFGDPVSNTRALEKVTSKDISSKIASGQHLKVGIQVIRNIVFFIRSMKVHNNKLIKKDLAFIDDE